MAALKNYSNKTLRNMLKKKKKDWFECPDAAILDQIKEIETELVSRGLSWDKVEIIGG